MMRLKMKILSKLELYTKDQKNEIIDSFKIKHRNELIEIEKAKKKEIKKMNYIYWDNIKQSIYQTKPFEFSLIYFDGQGNCFDVEVEIPEIKDVSYSKPIKIYFYTKDDERNEVGYLWFYFEETKSVIDLIDVKEQYRRLGIGSFMMKIFDDISMKNNCKSAYAWLSQADNQLRDIQIPFYKYNKFTIKFEDEDPNKNGSAKKQYNNH